MKIFRYIYTITLMLALTAGFVQAQPSQRNAQTIVGDALAKLPANDSALFNQLAGELLSTGSAGTDLLYQMLIKQDDAMVPVEYALGAIAVKATEAGGQTLASVAELYRGYADKSEDETVRQFFIRELMVMGVNYDNKNVTTSSEYEMGSTKTAKVKDLVKAAKKGKNKMAVADLLNRVDDVQAAKTAVAAALPSVKNSDIKAYLLWWLGEQKDKSLVPAFETCLLSGSDAVRTEAAWALTKTADASVLPVLARLVMDERDADLAEQCLKSFPGKVVDAVAPYYDNAGSAGKKAVLGLIGQRGATTGKTIVLKAVSDPSEVVRGAAYDALASVAQPGDLTRLYSMLETGSAEYAEPVRKAILAALKDKSDAEKYQILEAHMGSASAGKSRYWPLIIQVADIPQTLDIMAKNTADADLSSKALDAYISKVALAGENGVQRLLRYRAAMDCAVNDAQRNILLERIGATGAFQGIMYAAKFLDSKATEVAAANAIRTIVTSDPSYYGPDIVDVMKRIRNVDTGQDYSYDVQRIDHYLEGLPAGDPGYVSMFNGKDLTGWQGMIPSTKGGEGNPYLRNAMSAKKLAAEQAKADEVMARDWVVANGNIEFVGDGYDNLVSDRKYKDFEMYVDWKIYPGQKDGDAGIYLRSCPQVQIWDTARTWVGAEVGSGGLYNNKTNESKPLVVADNALGEWNSFYIRMQGERVTVYLNGQLVVDNTVLENYWDRSLPVPAEEYIELQAHGSRIAYRDLYIHELPSVEPARLTAQEEAEGFEMLFDGTSLHKWHGNKVDYNVVDGVIAVESRSRGGASIGDLYTNDEYGDFIFRFEFKLTPGANNGVGVRAPGYGDAAYEGYEIQILDHYNDIYKGWLAPYQYHGSVYGIIPAQNRDAFKPVGEWNSEEIYMKGSYVRVTLNGQVVTEGDIAEAAKNGTIDGKEHPGLKRTSGFIGFLGHGDQLWIRNVRVRKL